MAEFTPINTQEEFDAAISARLERERAKFADYEDIKTNAATLQTAIDAEKAKSTGYESTIADLNGKIKAYETDSEKTRIALEAGIPFKYRDRIRGESEDEMKADAAELAELFKQPKKLQPLREGKENPTGDKAEYAKMAQQLFNK